jgi:hypothetical protein
MKVRFISGINGDRVEVKITDGTQKLYTHAYSYGYNASHNRMFAAMAQADVENAKKYNWKTPYILKPFIGDILKDLAETYYIGNEDIEYSGYYVFAGREATPEEVQKQVDKIAKEM